MKRFTSAIACLAMVVATATQVQAGFIIDMEGIAPSGDNTSETNTNRMFSDFNVFTPHGHYFDSAVASVGTTHPDNGSDYLLNDSSAGITISKLSAGTFSVQSFDASEWYVDNTRNQDLQAIGVLSGGGTVTQTFITDSVFAFETFTLSSSFTNLTSFSLIDNDSVMAWDNIVVDQQATVPEPTSLAVFGLGALGLVASRRRRKVKVDSV